MKTKEQALEEVTKIFTQINSGRWEFSLHENCGWHWNITLPQGDGGLSIHQRFDGKFSCYASMTSIGSDDAALSDNMWFDDVNEAIKHKINLLNFITGNLLDFTTKVSYLVQFS